MLSREHRRKIAIGFVLLAFAVSVFDGFSPSRLAPWIIIGCAFAAFHFEYG
jgi:hypothetical protein